MATIADAMKVISALSKDDFEIDLLSKISHSNSLEKFIEENRFCNNYSSLYSDVRLYDC